MALTNAQYKTINRIYEEIQATNHYLAMERKAEVYKAVPAIEEIDNTIAGISRSAVRLLLDGDDQAKERASAQIKELAAKRTQYLVDAGFSADYLEPIYDCPACKDTGYITDSVSGVKQKCKCFRHREISLLYSQSTIESLLDSENFSTLSYGYYQGEDLQRFQSAVALSQAFVNNFTKDYSNILFYGTVGVGKSFLSGCIAKELIKNAHSVIYFSSVTFFEKLAQYAFNHDEKAYLQDFYDDLYACELLIIDDLGTELTNSFVASQLFSCLNERHLRKRSTIISTNLSLEEIRDRYSDRIFSRITSSFSLCKLTGKDIRIQKKLNANASPKD